MSSMSGKFNYKNFLKIIFKGELGLPFRTIYCSSKFAVTGFFESLRIELDLDNKDLSITIVCPPSVLF